MKNTTIKQQIYLACLALVDKNISTIQGMIQNASDSAQSDTKSTAGDKHETERAMMHLEQEKLGKQLHESLLLKEILCKINSSENHESIQLGSLVSATNGNFFISTGLGKIVTDAMECYAISLQSPIGKALFALKKGDVFSLNGSKHEVKEVW